MALKVPLLRSSFEPNDWIAGLMKAGAAAV
jgi:hypothetical protein